MGRSSTKCSRKAEIVPVLDTVLRCALLNTAKNCAYTPFGKERCTVMFDTNGGPISGGLTIGQLAAKLLQICSLSSWMTLCQSRARTT